jgi:hypothetical protein
MRHRPCSVRTRQGSLCVLEKRFSFLLGRGAFLSLSCVILGACVGAKAENQGQTRRVVCHKGTAQWDNAVFAVHATMVQDAKTQAFDEKNLGVLRKREGEGEGERKRREKEGEENRFVTFILAFSIKYLPVDGNESKAKVSPLLFLLC